MSLALKHKNMEGRVVVPAILTGLLMAACTKEPVHPNTIDTSIAQQMIITTASPAVYSSGWETIPAWEAATSNEAITFTYNKKLDGFSSTGDELVLVFARNLWSADSVFKNMGTSEKPLQMPFYFLPFLEKPNYTEQWNYKTEGDKISVSLTVKGSEDAALPNKKIQLRYIVLPASVVTAKKYTVGAVRKMPYDQLVAAFGLSR